MTETFYRFHWADCPEFSPENAWSALWGAERNEDGTQTRCACNGQPTGNTKPCPTCRGRDYDCDACDGRGWIDADCPTCDGTGWEDCVRGYSCWDSPQELHRYFAERGQPADDDGQVIVFNGRQADTGFDGEPCAVPDQITQRMTWTEFKNTLIAPEGDHL